jgi:hypothetical protein
MEPGKRGMRAYFDVEDVNAAAARERGTPQVTSPTSA